MVAKNRFMKWFYGAALTVLVCPLAAFGEQCSVNFVLKQDQYQNRRLIAETPSGTEMCPSAVIPYNAVKKVNDLYASLSVCKRIRVSWNGQNTEAICTLMSSNQKS